MNIELFSVEQTQVFFIVFARIAGFIGATPVFGSSQNPAIVKAAITLALSFCLFPVLENQITPPVDFSAGPLTLLVVSETLLGILMSLVAKLIFTAVQFGGTIIGFQMGFSAANVFDPQSQSQIQLISRFQNIFALLIFFSINGHYIFFHALLRSFELLPPGTMNFTGEIVPYLMKLTSHMFLLGVQFSAPVLSVLLLTNLILGALARVFPQLNVFMLSFPINIGTALVAIALTLNMVSSLIAREVGELGTRLLNIFTLLRL